MVRELPRVFRRVGQEQIYTGGFNPKPQMTFSPALSLGVISLGEYVDLRLKGAPADEHLADMLEVLNAHSPMGLRFTGITRLGPLDSAIAKVVDAARYLIVFSRDVVAAESQGAKPEAWLEQQIAALMARESAIVHRKVKGIHRTRDVRAFLKSLRTFEGPERLERAGLVGDLLTVDALVRVGTTGSAKVQEIAQVLFDTDEPPPHQAVRLSLLSERDGDLFEPLDLERLRVAERVITESAPAAAVAS
jgi:radical SAM-linked protein